MLWHVERSPGERTVPWLRAKEAEEADAVSEAQGAPRAPCPARITRRAAYDADARVGASSRPLEALAPSRGALTACALEAVRWDFAEKR